MGLFLVLCTCIDSLDILGKKTHYNQNVVNTQN
jgi:hypothetical protein